MNNFPKLLDYVNNTYWAMDEIKLRAMCDIFERHIDGVKLSAEQIAEIKASRPSAGSPEKEYEIQNGKAIIPVSGVIAKYSNMVNGSSQPRGTSLSKLSKQLNMALNDKMVNSILMVIESPGGSVNGLADFGDEVYQASTIKPIEAFVDDLGASAAYYIGSQAQRLYANQSASVGSIGTYTLIADTSELYANRGYKIHIVRSGANKGIGASGIPITDENIEAIQQEIDGHFNMFLNAVMRGRVERGLSREALEVLADGRSYLADSALQHKMIDGIMTLGQAIMGEAPGPRENIQEAVVVAAEGVKKSKSIIKEQVKMSEKKETTEAAVIPDTDKILAAERERVAAINGAIPGEAYAELRASAIKDGLSIEQVKAQAFEVAQKSHTKALEEKDKEIADSKARLDAISQGGDSTVSAPPENKEEKEGSKISGSGDDGQAETYVAAVKRFQGEGLTAGKAYQKAARLFPESQLAYRGTLPQNN